MDVLLNNKIGVEEYARRCQNYADQLTNPNHCFIELMPGQLVRHRPDPLDRRAYDNQPIRFTRLAAEAFAARMPDLPVKLISCDSIDGLLLTTFVPNGGRL